MKTRWMTITISLALAVGTSGVLPAPQALAATCTWTGAAGTAWETAANWSGCATAPANNDTVIIPDVANDPIISTAATSGLNVTILNGGVLTNSSSGAITFNNFTIDDGGGYIHDRVAALPGTTRTFGANSTVEFRRNTLNTCPVTATYGNLIINISNFTSNVGCGGNLASIAGFLEVKNTSGVQLRLVSTQHAAHYIGGGLLIDGGTLVLSSSSGAPAVSVGGDLNVRSGTLDLANSTGSPTLNIGGNFSQSGGTFTSSGSGVPTVVFTGGSSPSITFTASGGSFTNSNINWQIASGKTVALNTNFGAGSWVNGGRTMTVNGALQIDQGAHPGNAGAWSYGPGASLIFNNTSGSFDLGNEAWWPSGPARPTNVSVQGAGGITLNTARSVDGAFEAAAGVTNGNNLTLDGTVQLNTGGYFANSPVYGPASTLVYHTGGSTTISDEWTAGGTVGSGVPKNVAIRNSTAVVLLDGAGSRTVTGDLTIGPGSSLTLGSTIGDDLDVGGDWINHGTFQHNNRSVHFDGAGTQTIGGSHPTSFFDLSIEAFGRAPQAGDERIAAGPALAGATVVLATQPTIEGTVTNNGTLRQTKSVDNATVDFLDLKNDAGTIDKYFGVEISTANTLGSTTVSVSGNHICPQADGYPVKRCFDVAPANPAPADIRFYYQGSEMQAGQTYDTLDVWNYHGGAWNAVIRGGDSGACGASAINCYVQGDAITTYSPFALKTNSPAAVTLIDFRAAQQGDLVLLTWETASELSNRGFNLYRGTSPAGPDRQLNDALIPSQSPGSPGGFIYTWEDRADLASGTSYFYWVEDISLSGAATLHGPVSVVYVAPTAIEVTGFHARPLVGPGISLVAVLLTVLVSLAGAEAARRRRR